MKRLTAYALCILFIGSFACAPAANTGAPFAAQNEEPAVTAAPTPEPTPAPTPEPLGLAPIDLLGHGYNPLIDAPFPDGYTVYAARVDSADEKKGHGDEYSLYLTAGRDRAEIVRTCAQLLGITDEAVLAGYEGAMEKDGMTEFAGAFDGKAAYAWLKRTESEVESDQTAGETCNIEIAVAIDANQRAKYESLILANQNSTVLGALADRLPQSAIQLNQIAIYVNLQKPDQTEVYAYYAVDDAAALMNEITSQLETKWVDEQNGSLGISYGRIESGFRFLADENVVSVTLKPNDNTTPAGEFRLSDVSLSKLGFRYDEKARFCLLEDKQNGYMIGISKPEWHRTEEDWNLMFYKDDIYMTYREESNLFTVMATRAGEQTGCDYDCANGTFGQGWPSEETMLDTFSSVLGGAQEDVRAALFAVFTDLVQQRFGMSWQELYALPVW